MARTSKKPIEYINKERLHETFVQWYKDIDDAKANNLPEPECPKYIQQAIIEIPNGLGKLWKYNGYPFIDDMIGDAIYTLTKYYRNYNPETSNNPFGYFTMIASRCFHIKIAKEKKYLATKQKLILNSGILNMTDSIAGDDNDYALEYIEMVKSTMTTDYLLENKKKKEVEEKEVIVKPSIEDLF